MTNKQKEDITTIIENLQKTKHHYIALGKRFINYKWTRKQLPFTENDYQDYNIKGYREGSSLAFKYTTQSVVNGLIRKIRYYKELLAQ